MKKYWFGQSPESGFSRDEFAGTYVSEDRGTTLAQEFPESYVYTPWFPAMLFAITEYLHHRISGRMIEKYYYRQCRPTE